jgi:hypothetical protein
MTWQLRFSLWILAALMSFNICVGTGLISDWGKWYSPSLPYREQTDALLAGQLAISRNPVDTEFDMAWAEGGVQQVWGLGIPIWRLPFEIVARVFGHPSFPDRICLMIFIALVTYICLRVFTVVPSLTPGFSAIKTCEPKDNSPAVIDTCSWIYSNTHNPLGLLATMIAVAFPPMLTLFRGKFDVHDEAITYGYYYALALFAGLIAFVYRPSAYLYIVLSLLSGFAGFVRPTILAYGGATSFLALIHARRAKWGWLECLAGPGLFCASLGGLYWSNLVRFGSGLEFGHRINMTGQELLYLSRFDAPWNHEPLWGAIRELFGYLFFVNHLNGFNAFADGIVSWQSKTERMRHAYTTTFDIVLLCATIGLWSIAAVRACRKVTFRTRRPQPFKYDVNSKLISLTASWSLFGIIPLFAFYLYYCLISSMYVLDFAAAMSIVGIGILVLASNAARSIGNATWRALSIHTLTCAAVLWWAYDIAVERNYTTRLIAMDTSISVQNKADKFPILPRYYDSNSTPLSTGIPRNGDGWDLKTGRTAAVVPLFIDDPDGVIVQVRPLRDSYAFENTCRSIRAKIGLEELQLETVKRTGDDWRLIFSAPQEPKYRNGIQVLFLSIATNNSFRSDHKDVALLGVQWKRTDRIN